MRMWAAVLCRGPQFTTRLHISMTRARRQNISPFPGSFPKTCGLKPLKLNFSETLVEEVRRGPGSVLPGTCRRCEAAPAAPGADDNRFLDEAVSFCREPTRVLLQQTGPWGASCCCVTRLTLAACSACDLSDSFLFVHSSPELPVSPSEAGCRGGLTQ